MSEENNHIEQFFKKHLEVEQASFMEEDWAKMEAKLDAVGLKSTSMAWLGLGGVGFIVARQTCPNGNCKYKLIRRIV